jgi:hypothetical protein
VTQSQGLKAEFMSRPTRHLPRPQHSRALRAPAPLPDKGDWEVLKHDEKRKDGLHPFVGKTTPLGRKTERPDEGRPAGPSGQKEHSLHNRKHTNK